MFLQPHPTGVTPPGSAHQWAAVFTRPRGDPYSRCERLTVVFAGVCSSLCALCLLHAGVAHGVGVGRWALGGCPTLVLLGAVALPPSAVAHALFRRRWAVGGYAVGAAAAVLLLLLSSALCLGWPLRRQHACGARRRRERGRGVGGVHGVQPRERPRSRERRRECAVALFLGTAPVAAAGDDQTITPHKG
eukprot:gene28620-29056_t